MHETNVRVQALAKETNYLCNDRAAGAVPHAAAWACMIQLTGVPLLKPRLEIFPW